MYNSRIKEQTRVVEGQRKQADKGVVVVVFLEHVINTNKQREKRGVTKLRFYPRSIDSLKVFNNS